MKNRAEKLQNNNNFFKLEHTQRSNPCQLLFHTQRSISILHAKVSFSLLCDPLVLFPAPCGSSLCPTGLPSSSRIFPTRCCFSLLGAALSQLQLFLLLFFSARCQCPFCFSQLLDALPSAALPRSLLLFHARCCPSLLLAAVP